VRRILILVLAMTCGASTPAAAQWSVAAYLGDASLARGELRVESAQDDSALLLTGLSYDDESFTSPVYYGVRLTRFFRSVPWFGLEGEFIHQKVITSPEALVRARGQLAGTAIDRDMPLGEVLPRFELSHGLNLMLANAVFRLRRGQVGDTDPRHRWALSARGGAGSTLTHVEAQVGTEATYAYQLAGPAWHAAVGGEVRIWARLVAMGEVKWTATHQNLSVGSAQVSGPFRARHLVAGVSFDLQAPPSHRAVIR
jgi:hypothetical protein